MIMAMIGNDNTVMGYEHECSAQGSWRKERRLMRRPDGSVTDASGTKRYGRGEKIWDALKSAGLLIRKRKLTFHWMFITGKQ